MFVYITVSIIFDKCAHLSWTDNIYSLTVLILLPISPQTTKLPKAIAFANSRDPTPCLDAHFCQHINMFSPPTQQGMLRLNIYMNVLLQVVAWFRYWHLQPVLISIRLSSLDSNTQFWQKSGSKNTGRQITKAKEGRSNLKSKWLNILDEARRQQLAQVHGMLSQRTETGTGSESRQDQRKKENMNGSNKDNVEQKLLGVRISYFFSHDGQMTPCEVTSTTTIGKK